LTKIDVLIIDDDKGVCWFVSEMLRLNGFSNYSCSSGPEGLAQAEVLKPGLAIIDYKLGTMNGVEVAQRLKQVCPEAVIVMLTGYSPEAIKDLPGDLPVTAFLEKPFDINELLGTVRRALEPNLLY
jgi:DNA-binding NtrC family response regulator